MREGLCNQCEDALYAKRLELHKRDFASAIRLHSPVLCYSCGKITVDVHGNCLTHSHGKRVSEPWWVRLWRRIT